MEVKNMILPERVEQYIPVFLNVINMDTSGRAAEDVRHVEGVVKGTKTTWGKIVLMRLNVQTAWRGNPLSQDLVTYSKERRKY